jgi:hypothetical protein
VIASLILSLMPNYARQAYAWFLSCEARLFKGGDPKLP